MPHFHLTNCHGEWAALAVLLANFPVFLLWVKTRFKKA